MKFLMLFIALTVATEHNTESNEEIFEQNAYAPILVKIEEDEYVKVKNTKTLRYIGVFYNDNTARWQAQRWSKNEKKMVYNGGYKDEETAAHASDTLAIKLMENGEHHHKLNFPDDDTEVYPNKTSSKYIGVSYNETQEKWQAQRHSKNENKTDYYGCYKDEEIAAHASDTLARKLMANGEHKFKLNFPDDGTEVHPETKFSSKYIGVSCRKTQERWRAYRRSKNENKNFYNGTYNDEETAAHASDTLARELRATGEQNHKLNFPDDDIEVYPEEVRQHKRKRPDDFGVSHNDGAFEKFE